MAPKKEDLEFQEVMRNCVTLDEQTGSIKVNGIYASCYINFGWKGSVVSIPVSHVVWFKKHDRWPQNGLNIDHVNDDPMDNHPDNLQELSMADNHKKRRGRAVYRSYGKGKYGYGISVCFDKRDGRYYVRRQLSRGHGDGDLKNIRKSIGGFNTLEAAETRVRELILEIEAKGDAFIPEAPEPQKRLRTSEIDSYLGMMIQRRQGGMAFQAIADEFGFPMISVYNRLKDIEADARPRGEHNPSSVYTEAQVAEFKQLRRMGITVANAARQTGVGRSMAYQIESGHRWGHVN